MSYTKPTADDEKSGRTTDQLDGRTGEASTEPTPLEMPGAKNREDEIIDGLQSTPDVIENLISMVGELMYRMRQVEAVTEISSTSKASGGCGLNCANNSLNM